MFQGIYIPVTGPLEIINIKLNDIEQKLNCERSIGSQINYLEYFGYQPTIFRPESGDRNLLATLILKERGPVFGNAIILDDGKDLTLDDCRKIITIAKIVPSIKYVPEPIIERLLADPSESEFINSVIENMTMSSGIDKRHRDEIWSSIKQYYIPRPEDHE